jgi:hypothetical protein
MGPQPPRPDLGAVAAHVVADHHDLGAAGSAASSRSQKAQKPALTAVGSPARTTGRWPARRRRRWRGADSSSGVLTCWPCPLRSRSPGPRAAGCHGSRRRPAPPRLGQAGKLLVQLGQDLVAVGVAASRRPQGPAGPGSAASGQADPAAATAGRSSRGSAGRAAPGSAWSAWGRPAVADPPVAGRPAQRCRGVESGGPGARGRGVTAQQPGDLGC